jgi:uncharacterized protein
LQANYCSLKSLKQYSIPFTGLALGKHVFEYDIKDDFFNEFEYSLVKKADLKCIVELDRQETMLILTFDIKGVIGTECDKCLAEYPLQANIHEKQIVKFSEEEIDENEEIITLNKNDHEIMIASLIYEYINVAVPFIKTCGNEGKTPYCDKEMLQKLNAFSVTSEQSESDPRWDALKKFNK